MALSINYTSKICNYAEGCYAECRNLSIVMLNVIIPSVVMQRVITLSVVMLIAVILSVVAP